MILVVKIALDTKTHRIYFCGFVIALASTAFAAAPPVVVDEKLVANGKLDIRPAYPAEAQAQHLTGSGVFVLHLNPKNGRVQFVEVERSTGHKILDDASISAFANLQFKARGVARVKIPITFEIPTDNNGPRVTRNFPATWLAETQPLRINSGRNIGRR